ncbi:MAG: DUF4058 family protein [Gemmataceae bacterium]|nr:DUF4058 family protein [Gemmataceae bacterium]
MNPFPGMNPYLEDPAFWPDFHHEFISCWRATIARQLPNAYEARINERVRLVQLDPETFKLIYPDVAVTRSERPSPPRFGASRVVMLEPEIIPQEVTDEVRETRIEILHRPHRTLVAVLELLSPANKVGEGYRQYRAKRSALLEKPVHLLEVDLLAQGERLQLLKALPRGEEYAFLTRAEQCNACEVYAWSIRDRLPTLPLPLRHPDPDLHVDLQEVFDLAFERGLYGPSLEYGRDLPWLSAETQAWARERIQAATAQK